jgi:uncharacterized membrane protein HdeD (DUF308 family)
VTHNSNIHPSDVPHAGAPRRGLIIAIGAVMVVAGVAAILFPFISSLGVSFCVSWMLVIAAIVQSVNAFSQRQWDKRLPSLIIAALWLVGGLFLLMRPLEGVFVLTIIVAGVFIVEGIIKAFLAFQMRPLSGWGWVLFDGLAALVLGALLWWQLPVSALWALGTLAGINIVISGWTLMIVPCAVSAVMEDIGNALGDKPDSKPKA